MQELYIKSSMGQVMTKKNGHDASCDVEGWRERLMQAVESDPRAMRRIALDAGLSETFVWQMTEGGKIPSVSNFLKVCQTLGVSPVYILTGARADPETDALLRLWSRADKNQRNGLLAFLGLPPAS